MQSFKWRVAFGCVLAITSGVFLIRHFGESASVYSASQCSVGDSKKSSPRSSSFSGNPDCATVVGGGNTQVDEKTEKVEVYDLFEQALRHALPQTRVSWKIAGLNVNRRATQITSQKIIDLLFDPQTSLSLSMKEHVEAIGGKEMKEPALWNLYFTSYDQAVARTEYRDIFLHASAALSMNGTIADFGAGTGNGSVLLKLFSPARHMILIDSSSGGLEIAQKKLNFVTHNDSSGFEIAQKNLTTDKIPPGSLDGAIMNNVLYTLGDKGGGVLKGIYDALKPGGTLVLSDPRNFIKDDARKAKDFVTRVLEDSIRNGAPLTEYDVALVASINLQKLISAQSMFLTPDRLKQLAEEAGFSVVEESSGYYGAATFLVLRKL